jgi:hypothetical protein
MPVADRMDLLFVSTSFLFQIILVFHFALRKWRFKTAIRYGWIVYVLSIPAAAISILILVRGKSWGLWLGGFIYIIWAIYGYYVEYIKKIQWRSPIYWPVFGPYIVLYLATVMFYWWPLALIYKPLWYAYAILFIVSTILNIASHQEK